MSKRKEVSVTAPSTQIKAPPAALADVKITQFSWGKTGFGNVMEATFNIKNNSKFPIKDLEILAIHSAPSGTVIDSNERTIFESWKAGEERTISKFNMGFIHSQANRSEVRIKKMTVITPQGPVTIP